MKIGYIDFKSAREIEIENDQWKERKKVKSGPGKNYVDLTSLNLLYRTERSRN